MHPAGRASLSNTDYATVTVTFNPEADVLLRQLEALPSSCMKVIVDNASKPELRTEIAALASRVRNVHCLWNETNLGLAAAVNAGVHAVRDRASDLPLVLLLDQDTEPRPGSCDALREGLERLRREGRHVGGVGPVLMDPDTGLQHGFHQCTRWKWRRVYPACANAPVPCANLNGSGTLVEIAVFLAVGGLDESLFIDHLDTDWSFRVLAKGLELWGIPSAIFEHRMGQAGKRLWFFGWRIWPERSARRHYFLFRNAVVLMRRPYVPRVWKTWAVAKLGATALITFIGGPRRSEQLSSMFRGVADALRRSPG